MSLLIQPSKNYFINLDFPFSMSYNPNQQYNINPNQPYDQQTNNLSSNNPNNIEYDFQQQHSHYHHPQYLQYSQYSQYPQYQQYQQYPQYPQYSGDPNQSPSSLAYQLNSLQNHNSNASSNTLCETQNNLVLSNQKSVRKRAFSRRSKTGCLTCRERRIKCDETKPICKNCVKSKRCCNYQPAKELKGKQLQKEKDAFYKKPKSIQKSSFSSVSSTESSNSNSQHNSIKAKSLADSGAEIYSTSSLSNNKTASDFENSESLNSNLVFSSNSNQNNYSSQSYDQKLVLVPVHSIPSKSYYQPQIHENYPIICAEQTAINYKKNYNNVLPVSFSTGSDVSKYPSNPAAYSPALDQNESTFAQNTQNSLISFSQQHSQNRLIQPVQHDLLPTSQLSVSNYDPNYNSWNFPNATVKRIITSTPMESNTSTNPQLNMKPSNQSGDTINNFFFHKSINTEKDQKN
jgi:hypothetical protein